MKANLLVSIGSIIFFVFIASNDAEASSIFSPIRTLYRTGSVDALDETFKYRSEEGNFRYKYNIKVLKEFSGLFAFYTGF